MHYPQILVIILFALGLGISLAKHGERKEAKYNFITDSISVLILFILLYLGDFFG